MPGHRLGAYLITAALVGLAAAPASARDDKRDALWSAVRAGDTKAIQAALDKGARVNATNEIGVSALWIAASNGKPDVIELLVKRGADVNVRDGIWYMTPLSMSANGKKLDIVKLLIKSGAKDVDAALTSAASTGNEAMVKMILEQADTVRTFSNRCPGLGSRPTATDGWRKAWFSLSFRHSFPRHMPIVQSPHAKPPQGLCVAESIRSFMVSSGRLHSPGQHPDPL